MSNNLKLLSFNYYLLIGFLVVLTLGSFVLIKPSYIEYKNSIKKENKLKQEFEHKQSMNNKESYQKNIQNLHAQYTRLASLQSDEENLESELEKISQIGAKNGLIFEFLRPKSELVTKTYRRYLVSLRILGDYNQLAHFLSGLLQMNYRTRLADFKIIKLNSKVHKETEIRLVMTMELKLYQFFSFVS